LKDGFPVYDEFLGVLTELGIAPEWNFYKDGGSWLCKMLLKKKNMGWIAVFDGYFSITFYFLERHLEAIAELEISEQIKEDFCKAKAVGKLLPMRIIAVDNRAIKDIATVIQLKKILK
jgi:hypothetical protein